MTVNTFLNKDEFYFAVKSCHSQIKVDYGRHLYVGHPDQGHFLTFKELIDTYEHFEKEFTPDEQRELKMRISLLNAESEAALENTGLFNRLIAACSRTLGGTSFALHVQRLTIPLDEPTPKTDEVLKNIQPLFKQEHLLTLFTIEKQILALLYLNDLDPDWKIAGNRSNDVYENIVNSMFPANKNTLISSMETLSRQDAENIFQRLISDNHLPSALAFFSYLKKIDPELLAPNVTISFLIQSPKYQSLVIDAYCEFQIQKKNM